MEQVVRNIEVEMHRKSRIKRYRNWTISEDIQCNIAKVVVPKGNFSESFPPRNFLR